MDGIEIRYVIQFFFVVEKTAEKIHKRIVPTLIDSCQVVQT